MFSIGALWNFPVRLCAERNREGGSCRRAHGGPEWLRPLLFHHKLTLCQGFSTAIPRLVAIPRAQDVSDNVVTSHVMAGVIQPPVRSVKEWNPFIPSPPALPRQCPTQTRVLRAGDGIARLRIAFTQLGF